MADPTPEDVEKLSREMADAGRLTEAGWIGFRIAVLNPAAPAGQIDEMRMAFFAGATHLFASMMTMLEPDADATDKDLDRMRLIDAELKTFAAEFELRHTPPAGSG